MHMQFSEDSQHSYFFSQPHQPFFVLAFVNALVTMVLFLLSFNDIIHLSISASGFHIYGLTYLMFTPAFFAFLFTTFPRFTSTEAIPKSSYMRIFSFFYLGSIVFLLGSIVTPVFSGLAMLVLFIGHLMGVLVLRKIYLSTTMEDKKDVFWITVAMSFGLLSHLLFLISAFFYSPLMGLSTEISIYLYLFMLTFTVAQRMIPFFSHCIVEKNKTLLPLVFSLLLLHIIIEGIVTNGSFIVDILLGLVIAKEIYRWKLPLQNPNPLLWILHIGMIWIPVAFFISAIVNYLSLQFGMAFLALDTHILLLGFVFTILIGFGTRVTLGHSGNKMEADDWTKFLFRWTQVVVLMRIAVSLVAMMGWDIMPLFNLSVLVWILLFALWGFKFFRVLIEGKKLS